MMRWIVRILMGLVVLWLFQRYWNNPQDTTGILLVASVLILVISEWPLMYFHRKRLTQINTYHIQKYTYNHNNWAPIVREQLSQVIREYQPMLPASVYAVLHISYQDAMARIKFSADLIEDLTKDLELGWRGAKDLSKRLRATDQMDFDNLQHLGKDLRETAVTLHLSSAGLHETRRYIRKQFDELDQLADTYVMTHYHHVEKGRLEMGLIYLVHSLHTLKTKLTSRHTEDKDVA